MTKFVFPAQIVAFLFLFANFGEADDSVALLKTINIPGNFIDRSGLKQQIDLGIRHDQFGGISAMEYTGKDNLYLVLPDRGPKDGAVDWTCRFHLMQITPRGKEDKKQPDFQVDATVLLKDSNGKRFGGRSTIYEQTDRYRFRLDPEGVRQDKQGNVWISDEYGPHVLCFSATGELIQEIDVPAKFKIEKPGPDKATENAKNNSGRQGNRGMEGLAISKDGRFLYGLMQSPLLQDCSRSETGKPRGICCRLLKMEIATGYSSEYLYLLDDEKNKLNEILSLGDQQFLVIERDGKVGGDSKFKKIMKIDISDATAIEHFDALPADRLPENVNAVRKEVFIDLLDPKFGLAGSGMPEKIESIAFGPNLQDGRRLLLVVSDNDFDKSWPTKIFCFAISGEPKNNKLTTR